MADRETIHEKLADQLDTGGKLVTLLKIQEHALMSDEPENAAIFVPLFGIQLVSLLKGVKAERELNRKAKWLKCQCCLM